MASRRTAPTGPDLFTAGADRLRQRGAPLADRMRPRTLEEFVGQSHLVGDGRLLREMIDGQQLRSLILWGPPGTGKTSLALLIARSTDAHFLHFSAVLSGVRELRQAVEEARQQLEHHGRHSILFVDEIHRFNKGQQDALLPHVEDGSVTLIGATTENPSFEIIAPLLSRSSVLVLEPLALEDIEALLTRALRDSERGLGAYPLEIEPPALGFLAQQSRGDGRLGLNALQVAAEFAVRQQVKVIDLAIAEEATQHRALLYDKSGEEHYNVISAFIKSMRGSDPDAAVYWLMRMIEAGEDPLFIVRRMVVFAAEDIGNAEPRALQIAIAAKEAVHFIGMPEGRIPLAQAVTFLACAPKSNASYRAMQVAAADVAEHGALPVPMHLRNAPTQWMKDHGYGSGYQYAHDHEKQVPAQQHLPDQLKDHRYYEPTDSGEERHLRERLRELRSLLGKHDE